MTSMTDPITIAFCISNTFAQHAAVVIASVLASNPGECLAFHILSGDLSDANRALLSSMASERCSLAFHPVDRSAFDNYPTALEYFSQEIYYRYLIPELIPEKRVLYSDVDVLFYQPLRPLWEMDLQGALLGAVREFNEYRPEGSQKAIGWKNYKRIIGLQEDDVYLYSGLLLMDCDALRQNQFTAQCFEETEICVRTLDKEAFGAPDQVVINRRFVGKIAELSPAWCVTDKMKTVWKGRVGIRHFAGQYEKPWCNVAWNTSWPAYLKYLLRTPYRRNAWEFVMRHLAAIVYSSHVKKGVRRGFLFGLRIWKKSVD
ncbi:MAG: glycosyltransferase family 8 protein [Kiritimatiellae bacterium]|nr:glycosyltransferase family 8 protein [Kiritimatiellia bacterium]